MNVVTLNRYAPFEDRTIGQWIYHNESEVFGEWHSVELAYKGNEPNVSSIPEGVYPMRRFIDEHDYESSKNTAGYPAWEICNVLGRTVIVVHVANWAHELLGCVALGTGLYADLDGVSRSLAAIKEFYAATAEAKEIPLVVTSGPRRCV